MQRFLGDPFDSKLIKCTKPKPMKDKANGKGNEAKPGGGGAAGGGAMHNVTVSNYIFAGPAMYNAPVGFCQLVNGYAQMPYPQMVVVSPQPAPSKPADKGPPPHVCVACNAQNKCKQCLKKEEEEKNYVVKQSFSNPRGSYRPSIFSNKVIRSG
ncbi:hypothetical protein K501DRAFT_330402 [Backusella circina FSU 941]|nr:hypothetical protein K501DRAFT_330402 [Backusella circina FSU 941]